MSRRQIEIAPIRTLLANAAPAKAVDLDALLQGLSPVFEADDDEKRILFRADSGRNAVTIGLQSTARLRAHAFAAATICVAVNTPGFKTMQASERNALFEPADKFLTWAMGLDLQQWLKQIEGRERKLEGVLFGATRDLPEDLLNSLTERQVRVGSHLFDAASAFILLHELAHLHYGHRKAVGLESVGQEKEADRFAAGWLIDGVDHRADSDAGGRVSALVGIAVALIWPATFNIFLRTRTSDSHPEGYDRLFQVLDQVIDRGEDVEYFGVWYFVSTLLFVHMQSAGYDFDERDAIHMQDDPRDEVNHLINRISRSERKR